jgi:hypothetical protein
VSGEVPESEYPLLLEIIQETLGEAGRVEAAVGKVFAWSTEGVRGNTMTTRVQVSPHDGSTKITVTEDRSATIAVTVGLGTVVFAALALPIAETGGVALLPAVGILGVGGVMAVKAYFMRRRKLLADLLDRLTTHVRRTALRPAQDHKDRT